MRNRRGKEKTTTIKKWISKSKSKERIGWVAFKYITSGTVGRKLDNAKRRGVCVHSRGKLKLKGEQRKKRNECPQLSSTSSLPPVSTHSQRCRIKYIHFKRRIRSPCWPNNNHNNHRKTVFTNKFGLSVTVHKSASACIRGYWNKKKKH